MGGNGKKYLDITLADASAETSGKKWDIDDGELPKLKPHGGITVAVKAGYKGVEGFQPAENNEDQGDKRRRCF